MFLKNSWYVAGWSSELQPGQLIGRVFLDEPVVLFRGESGVVAALEDRCVHRAVPLSTGHVDCDILRCAYHGLEFAADGVCVRIPAQDSIPPQARVRAYPIVEQDALIWIWMGDPERAESAAIPWHPYHEDPKWGWKSTRYAVEGNWLLLIENLLDLSHLPYIHPKTVGGNPDIHFRASMETKRLPNGVFVQRRMPGSQPPPTYVAAKGFTGLIDRWQEIEFQPGMLRVHTGACNAGTGAYDGLREHGLSMIGFHGVTPETERTTHYFWSIATNVLEPGIPELVFQQTADTFREDQAILEQQQRRIESDPDRPLLAITTDAAALYARGLLMRLMDAERRPSPIAAQREA